MTRRRHGSEWDWRSVLRLPDPTVRPPDVENDIIRFFGKLGVIEAPAAWSSASAPTSIGTRGRRAGAASRVRRVAVCHRRRFSHAGGPESANLNQPDLSKAFAIRVRRSEGVIFAPGAWHWVPYPLKKGKSFALVGFAIDTPKNDMFTYVLNPALRIIAPRCSPVDFDFSSGNRTKVNLRF